MNVSVEVPLVVAPVLRVTVLDAVSTDSTVVPETMPVPETVMPTEMLVDDVTETVVAVISVAVVDKAVPWLLTKTTVSVALASTVELMVTVLPDTAVTVVPSAISAAYTLEPTDMPATDDREVSVEPSDVVPVVVKVPPTVMYVGDSVGDAVGLLVGEAVGEGETIEAEVEKVTMSPTFTITSVELAKDTVVELMPVIVEEIEPTVTMSPMAAPSVEVTGSTIAPVLE